jgi:hypothetical protein
MLDRIKDHVSRPDPAWRRSGYWIGGFGVVLTILMGIGAIANPQIRASRFLKIPPCLILAGLALEAGEVVMGRRSQ